MNFSGKSVLKKLFYNRFAHFYRVCCSIKPVVMGRFYDQEMGSRVHRKRIRLRPYKGLQPYLFLCFDL